MKKFAILFAFALLISSCTSYQASLENKNKQRYGVTSGKPVWKEKRTSSSNKLLAPLAGAGVGYLLSGNQSLTLGGNSFTPSESSAILAAGGFALGLGVNVLVHKLSPSKTFNTSQQDKWLQAYNKRYRSNYVFPDPSGNTQSHVSIMRQDKYARYIKDYDATLNQAESGFMNFNKQNKAYDKLDKEFSVLSSEKQSRLKNALGKAKHAYAEKRIIRKINEIEAIQDKLERSRRLANISKTYSTEFYSMTVEKQESYYIIITNKIKDNLSIYIGDKEKEVNSFSLDDLRNINTINSLLHNYKAKIEPLKYYHNARSYYITLENTKTDIIEANVYKIEQWINDASSTDDLQELRIQYLENTRSQSRAVKHLYTVIDHQEKSIISRLKLEALAQQTEQSLRHEIMMQEKTTTGEPTQAQMKYAIATQLERKQQQIDKLSQVSPDDPILQLTRIFGGLANLHTIKLISVQKLGCKESPFLPGYICDYTAKFNVSGGVMANTFEQTQSALGNEIKTGRFSKVQGEWMLVETIR